MRTLHTIHQCNSSMLALSRQAGGGAAGRLGGRGAQPGLHGHPRLASVADTMRDWRSPAFCSASPAHSPASTSLALAPQQNSCSWPCSQLRWRQPKGAEGLLGVWQQRGQHPLPTLLLASCVEPRSDTDSQHFLALGVHAGLEVSLQGEGWRGASWQSKRTGSPPISKAKRAALLLAPTSSPPAPPRSLAGCR